MSGNENSGRKPNKIPSFEVRFSLEGRFKKDLEKLANNFKVGINQYVKWLTLKDLEK